MNPLRLYNAGSFKAAWDEFYLTSLALGRIREGVKAVL